jgi:hypothetical protein
MKFKILYLFFLTFIIPFLFKSCTALNVAENALRKAIIGEWILVNEESTIKIAGKDSTTQLPIKKCNNDRQMDFSEPSKLFSSTFNQLCKIAGAIPDTSSGKWSIFVVEKNSYLYTKIKDIELTRQISGEINDFAISNGGNEPNLPITMDLTQINSNSTIKSSFIKMSGFLLQKWIVDSIEVDNKKIPLGNCANKLTLEFSAYPEVKMIMTQNDDKCTQFTPKEYTWAITKLSYRDYKLKRTDKNTNTVTDWDIFVDGEGYRRTKLILTLLPKIKTPATKTTPVVYDGVTIRYFYKAQS